MAILKHGHHTIIEDDPFGEIAIPMDEAWLMLGLGVTLEGGLSATLGHFNFGFSKGEELSVRGYRRFRSGPGGFPEFREALGKSFAGFQFPASFADLGKLDQDFVLVLSGTGTLTASAGFSLATPVSALASFSLAGVGELGVKAGASIDVGAGLTLSGGYQVRLRRVANGNVELGVYSFESSEEELTVAARVGVKAGIGRFDLTEQLIRRLNNGPVVDSEEFLQALPGEDDEAKDRRIEGFERKLRAASSRKLEVAVEAAFSNLETDEAAWLYEIDPSATQAAPAVEAALAGDFSPLTSDPDDLPQGVEPMKNILTHSEVKRASLRFHMLGFVDASSSVKLIRSTEMELGPDGNITLITDTSSANRLNALMAGFGRDRRRLRQLLSENFVIQAVYKAADLGFLPPEFNARHSYFEIHDSTGREEMKNNLDVPRVLGLIPPEAADRRLGNRKKFGRTTFYAEAAYQSDALKRLFLDEAGEPRPVGYYEERGRSALGALLAGDDGQPTRTRAADLGLAGNTLWNDLRAQGPTAFGAILNLPRDSPELGTIIADYLTIVDWAEAMNMAATALRDVRAVLAGGSTDRLAEARELLKKRLASVAGKSREHFGDPLGLVMVYVAANQDAEVGVLMTGAEIDTLELGTAAIDVGRSAAAGGQS